jgi:hypothetical protein
VGELTKGFYTASANSGRSVLRFTAAINLCFAGQNGNTLDGIEQLRETYRVRSGNPWLAGMATVGNGQ